MSKLEARINVNLWGAFSIYSENGLDITPRLLKCQALIALLATTGHGKRARSWLQSRLWSDRGDEQASGSLRQALAEIRKTFGADQDILTANRQRVLLDLSRVDLRPRGPGEEFLEGMDLRDEEFEDWLRLERAHQELTLQNQEPSASPSIPIHSPLVARPKRERPTIMLAGSVSRGESMNVIEVFLVDCVARSLRENLSVPTFTHDILENSPDQLNVQISAPRIATDQVFLSASVIHAGSTELLWSGHQSIQSDGPFPFESLDVLGWVNEIVAAIAEYLGRVGERSVGAQNATHLGLTALRELFSLQSHRVEEADRMLAQAYEIDPRAIFMAWRAQLRGIQFVERHSDSWKVLREEGLMFARAALEAEPSNSSVLATTANARLILDNDIVASEELSRESVAQNGSNPLAWWSRAFTYLYTDRLEEAFQASMRGHQLSKGSPYRFWWDMQVALSASAAKRYDKAIQFGERCATFAPESRPPLRYLIGLHAENGSLDRSLHWARKLKQLEPDFSVERLVTDGDYPASLIRKYDLVKIESLAPLKELV